MLKKTLIASATASLIAMGALASTTGAANAHGKSYYGGHQKQVHYNYKRQNRHCRPIYKRVMWRDRWGRAHWKKARVGFNCNPPRRHYRAHQRRHWGWSNNSGVTIQFGW